MPRPLNRERLEKMIQEGKVKPISVSTLLRPDEILRLDEIAKAESRTVCGLLTFLARERIEEENAL